MGKPSISVGALSLKLVLRWGWDINTPSQSYINGIKQLAKSGIMEFAKFRCWLKVKKWNSPN